MPQQPKTPKIKHRAKVRLTDSKGQTINVGYWSSGVQEFTDTYGRHAHLTLRFRRQSASRKSSRSPSNISARNSTSSRTKSA